jgi:4-hydroxybenzoate polyprenyltransferase
MLAQRIKIILDEMRLNQWIKNLLIFLPLIFAKKLIYGIDLRYTIVTFIAFSLAASGVYILNDLFDVKKDQFHPQKSKRPLAMGKISIFQAKILSIILIIISLTLAILVNQSVFWILILYFLLNVFYSFKLKKIVIIDLMTVAIMYLIRVYIGAAAIRVPVSSWLLLTTLLGAIFIVACKRRSEITLGVGQTTRDILSQYTSPFLDSLIGLSGMAMLIFYALYSMTHPGTFIWSILFVIYILFRYLWLILANNQGEEPEKLILKDRPIFFGLILWAAFVILSLY